MSSSTHADAAIVKRPHRIAIGISVIAGCLAVAHMALPSVHVDVAVLVLLIIGATPWLAPFVKSIKLPGGAEVELQEVKDEIRTLGQRVEETEKIAITGAISADLSLAMRSQLLMYQKYLRGIGLEAADPPPVEVDPTLAERRQAVSGFFGDRLLIDAAYVNDTDWVLRDYTHFVLTASKALDGFGDALVESGVAAYFVCSFRDDGVFGKKTLSMHGAKQRTFRLEAETSIDAKPPSDSTSYARAHAEQTEAWAGMLWDVRKQFGSIVCDELVAKAWQLASTAAEGGMRAEFPRSLLKAAEDLHAPGEIETIREMMRRRRALPRENHPHE